MKNVRLIFFTVILFFHFPIFAGEKSIYDFHWLDPEKVIYVLQNKVYEKKKTLFFDVGHGSGLSSDFQDASLAHLKTGYFFAEEWGVELFYTKVSNKDSDTLKNISSSEVVSTVPFIRRFNSYYGAFLIFSPFYAKINTFNKIIYFDWNFGLGVMSIEGESNKLSFRSEDDNNPYLYQSESYQGIAYKTEFRVYLSRRVNINLELMRFHYSAESPIDTSKKSPYSNTDYILSIGFNI